MSRALVVVFAAALHVAGVGLSVSAQEGSLLFSQTGGKVFVSGNTALGGAVTAEARILFTEQFDGFGSIFNEWRFATEDKAFYAGPGGVEAFFLGASDSGRIVANRPISRGVWHHVAWELSGGIERLYIDGQVANERSAQGGVTDHAEGGIVLGSNRGQDALLGYIDWLRVSNSAPYGGDSFVPPTGSAGTIGNSVILYNFGQIGASSFSNEAGGGNSGTLGNHSQIVPNPAAPSIGDLTGDGELTVADYTALWLGILDPGEFANQHLGIDHRLVGDVNGSGAAGRDDASIFGDWFGLQSAGDYNSDSHVDAIDYAVWRESLGNIGTSLSADGDIDGDVDASDFGIWRHSYGAASSGVAKIPAIRSPEPQAAMLLTLLILIATAFPLGPKKALHVIPFGLRAHSRAAPMLPNPYLHSG